MHHFTFNRVSTPAAGLLPVLGLLLAQACATAPAAPESPSTPESSGEVDGSLDAPAAPGPSDAPNAPASSDEPGPDQETSNSVADSPLAAIQAALEAGELETAWRGLGALLLANHLQRARDLVAVGEHLEALEEFDGALALDGRSLEALLGRGEACLAIGIAGNDAFFLEDGRANLVKAARLHDLPGAWLAASRASRLGFDYSADPQRRGTLALDALEQARRGAALAEDQALGTAGTTGGLLPARVRAEAAFRAWLATREGLLKSSPEALFQETEDNLMVTLAEQPADPWPYLELANLYQWAGRLDDTLQALLRGLELNPLDPALLERLGAVGREVGGRARLLEIYGKLAADNPDQAVLLRLIGTETFWSALEALEASQGGAELFRRAEAAFRRCREVDELFTEECLGWEITCRNGLGYALYHAADLKGARRAFLSMEELKEGGLTWQLGQRLPSGLMGLSFIVDRLARDVNVSTMEVDNLESLEQAAAISDYLHAYDPEHPEWANNAGFFNRDYAFALETQAQAQLHGALRAADEAATPQEEAAAQAQTAAGLVHLTRARERMERSYAAYVNAARLSDEDVRVVNDTGLILTYYLQRDLAAAESYLLRAVALGKQQLEARTNTDGEAILDEDQLYNLLNAWGDAHQNLGVLYLTLKYDPGTARDWFEKAVEIGPDPREAITMPRGYLAQCDLALAGKLDPATLPRWGVPPGEHTENETNK
ncbi:MAG: hypothetical protein QF724_05515 [Planctomycetota bacterium]|nr:hypothetical protein [Planctomycetota bacterium]MDP6838378.1 hypothetical protein [Planctomycetota bacterium]